MPQRPNVAVPLSPASARGWQDLPIDPPSWQAPARLVSSARQVTTLTRRLPMAKTVGDFLVARLRAWGVQRVFGYPGDGINGIMAGLERAREEGPRFIQARHEELAAFMAGAHAKFTGEAGVCLATSGPGAIHLLNGLYDAAMDHQPVVAIVGQAATTAVGGDYQQEGDLQTLYKDVAHNYGTTVMHPAAIR